MTALKTSKENKKWFAQRCGEMLLKVLPGNISIVLDDALEYHEMENTPENRCILKEAYKTANPNRTQYAAKTYDPFYQLGAEKNDLGEERRRILGYLEIDRQISLHAVRTAIAKAFVDEEISSLNPKHLDIFDKPHQLLDCICRGKLNTPLDETDSVFDRLKKPSRN